MCQSGRAAWAWIKLGWAPFSEAWRKAEGAELVAPELDVIDVEARRLSGGEGVLGGEVMID